MLCPKWQKICQWGRGKLADFLPFCPVPFGRIISPSFSQAQVRTLHEPSLTQLPNLVLVCCCLFAMLKSYVFRLFLVQNQKFLLLFSFHPFLGNIMSSINSLLAKGFRSYSGLPQIFDIHQYMFLG